MFRRLAAALLAATVVGLLLGAVSRVLMRVVALVAGTPGAFSWSGSLGICAIFAAAMLPGAFLAAFTVRRLRWALPVAGALFLCVPAVGVAAEEVGHTAGFTFVQWAGVVIAGAGVFVAIAFLPTATVRLVDRLTGAGRRPSRRSQLARARRLGRRAAPARHGTRTTAVVGPPDRDAEPANRGRAE